jgi:hypothetical protein
VKLAIVAGGWHWPFHFFEAMARDAAGADLYVIAHRSPELPIVREEKHDILARAQGPLARLDQELYASIPTIHELQTIGWNYADAPNTVGDWGFFNQWLERHDYRNYDVLLNCHDDTFVRQPGVFDQLGGDWLLLANGTYPQAPPAYVRGSFEFWKPELLDRLGGHIDLGDVHLTREGQTDTPLGLHALSSWNDTGVPLRHFLVNNGLAHRVAYLSPYYRISRWIIEAERGFLHYQDGAPWSVEAGIQALLPAGSMADAHQQGVTTLR